MYHITITMTMIGIVLTFIILCISPVPYVILWEFLGDLLNYTFKVIAKGIRKSMFAFAQMACSFFFTVL